MRRFRRLVWLIGVLGIGFSIGFFEGYTSRGYSRRQHVSDFETGVWHGFVGLAIALVILFVTDVFARHDDNLDVGIVGRFYMFVRDTFPMVDDDGTFQNLPSQVKNKD